MRTVSPGGASVDVSDSCCRVSNLDRVPIDNHTIPREFIANRIGGGSGGTVSLDMDYPFSKCSGVSEFHRDAIAQKVRKTGFFV